MTLLINEAQINFPCIKFIKIPLDTAVLAQCAGDFFHFGGRGEEVCMCVIVRRWLQHLTLWCGVVSANFHT